MPSPLSLVSQGRATRSALALAFVLTAAAAWPRTAIAQPSLKDVLKQSGGTPNNPPAPAAPAETPDDELNRGTPRGTVEGFLNAARDHDYDRAAQYLFLGRLPRGLSESDGPRLARELKIVLDKTLWIDVSSLSRKPAGKSEDGLPSTRERVGTIETKNGNVDILLHRVRKDNGVQIWKFASVTVAKIPALYKEFGYGPFANLLPPVFFEFQVLGLQLWQAIGLPALVVVSYLLGLTLASLILVILRHLPFAVAKRVGQLAAGPLRLVLSVSLFAAGEHYLSLPLIMRGVLTGAERALIIVAITWVFMRILDICAHLLMESLLERGQANVMPLIPPGRRIARVILVFVAGLVMLDSFGFDVTTVLAGLGVGGIAVALAAQKSIENLFGGATLYADRPVRVGDFCRFGDYVGTVEEIGLRSTRVRTLDRTLVTVANSEFANMQLENFAARDKFWYHPRIGLRYETTPEQLRYILVAVREMLYAHPKVDPDPARIRFVNFGAYSLDLDIFAYVNAADYNEFLSVSEDLNLRIMDIVQEGGSSFAFPSQTTYIESGEPLSKEQVEVAEKRVAEWRKEGRLYLPNVPAERIAEIKATLDYPPEGSPHAGDGDPSRR